MADAMMMRRGGGGMKLEGPMVEAVADSAITKGKACYLSEKYVLGTTKISIEHLPGNMKQNIFRIDDNHFLFAESSIDAYKQGTVSILSYNETTKTFSTVSSYNFGYNCADGIDQFKQNSFIVRSTGWTTNLSIVFVDPSTYQISVLKNISAPKSIYNIACFFGTPWFLSMLVYYDDMDNRHNETYLCNAETGTFSKLSLATSDQFYGNQVITKNITFIGDVKVTVNLETGSFTEELVASGTATKIKAFHGINKDYILNDSGDLVMILDVGGNATYYSNDLPNEIKCKKYKRDFVNPGGCTLVSESVIETAIGHYEFNSSSSLVRTDPRCLFAYAPRFNGKILPVSFNIRCSSLGSRHLHLRFLDWHTLNFLSNFDNRQSLVQEIASSETDPYTSAIFFSGNARGATFVSRIVNSPSGTPKPSDDQSYPFSLEFHASQDFKDPPYYQGNSLKNSIAAEDIPQGSTGKVNIII